MASLPYIQGRKRFPGRPQAMLWADNSGTLIDGKYVPLGIEFGADVYSQSADNEFIILSDHNREPIDFKPTRIEKRERMASGRMRAYHIADKLTISTSWAMLPSRAYSTKPDFETSAGQATAVGKSPLQKRTTPAIEGQEYTADGGAGGVELLNWYENHQGSFWVYLAYDKFDNFGNDAAAYNHLNEYNQVVEVFFADFSYTVVKRGQYDFWNISVTLEEV